jgi:hypothetical protein
MGVSANNSPGEKNKKQSKATKQEQKDQAELIEFFRILIEVDNMNQRDQLKKKVGYQEL